MDTELWIHLHQQMHMVRHNLHFQNIHRQIYSILLKQFL